MQHKYTLFQVCTKDVYLSLNTKYNFKAMIISKQFPILYPSIFMTPIVVSPSTVLYVLYIPRCFHCVAMVYHKYDALLYCTVAETKQRYKKFDKFSP